MASTRNLAPPLDRQPPEQASHLIDGFVDRLTLCSSATLLLHQWCSELHGVSCPPVVARLTRATTEEERGSSGQSFPYLADHQATIRRRARLMIGRHILSKTDLHYFPDHVPADMRRTLAETQRPFGAVIQPLSPDRIALKTHRLWLPHTTEQRLPPWLIEHHALVLVSGTPIAWVREIYSRHIVDFGRTAPA